MFKNKKFLFIFTLILVTILNIPLKSFCSTDSTRDTTTGFTEEQVKIIKRIYDKYSSNYNSYVCREHGGVICIYLYNYSSDLFFYVSEGILYSSIECSPYYVEFDNEGNIKRELQGTYNQVYAYADGKPNIYSNRDVYTSASKDMLFFQVPPLLAPVVEKMKMKITLQEVVQLLPMILAVVVFFLGLRKALQVLSRILLQS